MKRTLFLMAAIGITIPVMALRIDPSGFRLGDCSSLSFSGGAEALYWRACEQGVEYGFYQKEGVTSNFTSNDLLELQPQYGWGFRLFGKVFSANSCRFAELEWIHFRNTSTAAAKEDPSRGTLRVAASGIIRNRTAFGIRIRQRDRYNNVTLRLAQQFTGGCWGSFYGYLGGGWREIKIHDRYDYKSIDPAFAPISQDSIIRFCGGAMVFGLGATVDLGCGFGSDIRAGFTVSIGGLSASLEQVAFQVGASADGISTSNEPSQVNCLAGYEAAASVHYTRECGCLCLRGEVGYRIDYYFNLASKTTFTNIAEATEPVSRGYGGPFIGASICY